MSMDGTALSHDELRALLAECRHRPQCRAGKEAGKPTPWAGPIDAKVMIVGRNPGRTERDQGAPFVGPCARYIDVWLLHLGMRREEVYITNLLKCYTSSNREPTIGEASTCVQRFLLAEIEIIRPIIILLMGDLTCRVVTGKRVSEAGAYHLMRHKHFSKLCGHDCYVVFCYHPGVCVRGNPEWARRCAAGFRAMAEDVQKALNE